MPVLHARQLTLGKLIELLEQQQPTKQVVFDFCRMVPTMLDSYRGYYVDLALGYGDSGSPTVADLLALLKRAVGNVYSGYKGGHYRMDNETALWVANYSHTSDTVIVGVHDSNWEVVLETTHINLP